MNLTGHKAKVTCLQSQGDDRLFSGSEDFMIRIWNSQTGRCLKVLADWEGLGVTCMKVYGNLLLSGTISGSIRAWNLEERTPLKRKIEDSIYPVTFLELQGEFLFSTSYSDSKMNIRKFANSLTPGLNFHPKAMTMIRARGSAQIGLTPTYATISRTRARGSAPRLGSQSKPILAPTSQLHNHHHIDAAIMKNSRS